MSPGAISSGSRPLSARTRRLVLATRPPASRSLTCGSVPGFPHVPRGSTGGCHVALGECHRALRQYDVGRDMAQGALDELIRSIQALPVPATVTELRTRHIIAAN